VLVAAVLLVTGIMGRLSNPRMQQLLGLAERPIAGGAPLTDQEIADEDVDTRLARSISKESTSAVRVIATKAPEPESRPSTGPEEPQAESSAGPAVGAAATIPAEAGPGSERGDEGAVLETAWRDAWIALLRDCPVADENRLYDRLRAARGRGALPGDDAADAAAWKSRVVAWDAAWQKYVKEARAGLAELPANDRGRWNKVLDKVTASWLTLWRPLLETLGQEPPEARELVRLVELLQDVADEKSLQAIQDDTIWRGTESNIWFRLVERIRASDPEQLRQASLGPTGYLQLFKQPEYYRGKVVTVRGTVRLAYRVDAPTNVEGVKEYTLLWLHPAGGPSSPMVVYALETPEGFPAIKHRDRDRSTTTMHEEVEFTGYFFKRWAYDGRDGIHVAPLVLAVSPRWIAPTTNDAAGLGGGTIALAIIVSAALGIAAALFAYRNTRRL